MKCRSCGMPNLKPILSLGNMPLANGLLKLPDEPEEKYPLDLAFCPDCTLVQLTGNVDPDKMFKDYKYYSSGSQTMLNSAADLVEKTIASEGLNKDSLVIEIASNDGYLLKNYVKAGIPVLGIDPCTKIAEVAENNGVPTRVQYFTKSLAERLSLWSIHRMPADIIHANNIMAHLPDLNDVVEGISILLKPNGIAIIETPYIRDMIDNCEFDTIYHEHLCYYSLTALSRLFNRHGLSVVDVEHLDIHGGSLRITVSPNAERYNERVANMLMAESITLDDYGYYQYFGKRVEVVKDDLSDTLYGLKLNRKHIVGYAASAKGSVLMNYCGIGQYLDYVVDNTPAKQGLYTPGTHLEICGPSKLLETQPDYALLLAWNFADEIMSKEQEYIKRGGKFIVPIPRVRIV